MSTPLVSVIVPTYNGRAFIEDTLTSLHLQTFRDFEVIVVDDGSSDATLDVVRRHPLSATVLTQPNRGVAVARNHGTMRARGTWLAYIDQDDLWHNERLERVMSRAEEMQSEFVMTTERGFAVEEDRAALTAADPVAAEMPDVWLPENQVLHLCSSNDLLRSGTGEVVRHFSVDDLLCAPGLVTTSFFVTRDQLQLLGGWSPHGRSLDDWWLTVNAARFQDIPQLDEPSHLYRIHSKATSRQSGLAYAFAASQLALRYGGMVVPNDAAFTPPSDSPTLHHLALTELTQGRAVSDRARREALLALTRLTWPDGSLLRQYRRARLAARWPTLRRVRRRLSLRRCSRG